jgi:hypothetical protein
MPIPRREFLWRTGRAGAGLAVLDRAGRFLLGNGWTADTALAAAASNPPVDLRFRQVHLDFHSSADVTDIAAHFDPDEFAETLKRAHVDSVTCFARCHHGYIYYDTKKNPERKHPHLKRKRLLEEQIEACHKRGIRVPIYTTIQWDAFSADEHPEWRQVTETGTLQGTPPYEPGFYRFMCLNPALARADVEGLIDCGEHLVEAGQHHDLDQPGLAPPCRGLRLQIVGHDLPRGGLRQDSVNERIGLGQRAGAARPDRVN